MVLLLFFNLKKIIDQIGIFQQKEKEKKDETY